MAVIRRLPKYYRYLSELIDNDVDRISSKELSEKIGFTASQIRQDLNNFGDFGQQGYGYNVKDLYNEIRSILGLNGDYNIVIVGAGNIGQAIANYTNFDKMGFNLKGRSEEHTSELQSRQYLVCRLLLEKKQNNSQTYNFTSNH